MIQTDTSDKLRRTIFARDGYRCTLCGDTHALQVCRVIEGGSDHEQNLIALCANCRALAHGMPAQGWAETPQEVVQHGIVGYLADFYGSDWNPYRKSCHQSVTTDCRKPLMPSNI